MRVFPFSNKALRRTIVVPAAQPEIFIMEYPCVVGFMTIIDNPKANNRRRSTWYQVELGGLNHSTWSRESATVINTKEELDKVLTILSLMEGVESVFVEPHKQRK